VLEEASLDSNRRVFRHPVNLALSEQSCFVLTAAGYDFARRQRSILEKSHSKNEDQPGLALPRGNQQVVPWWDGHQHTLLWKGKVVKHFKSDAPYQEGILAAFQRVQWARFISIHFPEDRGVNSKERLHDTIKNLNRNVRPHLRFHQEGSGSRVSWEALESGTPALPHSYP
jgi:hypothetical protein